MCGGYGVWLRLRVKHPPPTCTQLAFRDLYYPEIITSFQKKSDKKVKNQGSPCRVAPPHLFCFVCARVHVCVCVCLRERGGVCERGCV